MASNEKRTPFVAQRFVVEAPDGRRYTVQYWQWKIDFRQLDGSIQTTFNGWKYETTCGKPVNESDGTLTLALTGETLVRL